MAGTPHWKTMFNWDRGRDWLADMGRSGRLVSHVRVPTPDEIPDTNEPRIVTKGGDGQPVTAVIQTDQDEPMTRERATEINGRLR
jgi:hypothetical protein